MGKKKHKPVFRARARAPRVCDRLRYFNFRFFPIALSGEGKSLSKIPIESLDEDPRPPVCLSGDEIDVK
jgi:hypothetical protein